MKRILAVIFALMSLSCFAEDRDSLLVMFWNLENFFDHIDQGTGESDKEFSSYGTRRWTKKRFHVKCDAVAKSIMWIGEQYGRMPDVIGLAEIENRGVLYKLLNTTLLRKYDYRIVHFESSDRRGIDVALLFRRSSMDTVFTSLRTPEHDGHKMNTRDILHVRMRLCDGDEMDFIVNHHPSKYGGEEESSGRRVSAMQSMMELCDSLDSDIIISMGDFNDTPDAPAFRLTEDRLMNKARYLHQRGEGTIRYEGRWDMIDMFLVSPELDTCTVMEVCRIPFLTVRDTRHTGLKPFRTYSGPRYIGGVSDHYPIILIMNRDKIGVYKYYSSMCRH